MSIFSDLPRTLAATAAILVLKHASITLLQVRERSREGAVLNPEDTSSAIKPLFPILGAGPSFGGRAFLDRCDLILMNNIYNEPMFLALAFAALGASAVPENAITITQVFLGARIGHSLSYLFGTTINSVFRTATFLTGFAATGLFAVSVLQGLGDSSSD